MGVVCTTSVNIPFVFKSITIHYCSFDKILVSVLQMSLLYLNLIKVIYCDLICYRVILSSALLILWRCQGSIYWLMAVGLAWLGCEVQALSGGLTDVCLYREVERDDHPLGTSPLGLPNSGSAPSLRCFCHPKQSRRHPSIPACQQAPKCLLQIKEGS